MSVFEVAQVKLFAEFRAIFGDRQGIPENFCDKDFAELSGELSGAICLKTLVLMDNDR